MLCENAVEELTDKGLQFLGNATSLYFDATKWLTQQHKEQLQQFRMKVDGDGDSSSSSVVTTKMDRQ
jgi:hypothetical protein